MGKSGSPMGKGQGRNPFDPSGRQMQCFRCGSRDHLVEKCPIPKGKGKGGSGKKGRFLEEGNGFWVPGAVDGLQNYSGFTLDADGRSFMTVQNGEHYLLDSDGEVIPEEYAASHREESVRPHGGDASHTGTDSTEGKQCLACPGCGLSLIHI